MPSTRQLRMTDIAHMAGVDVSTVSRALAGSPRVTEETRARIAQIVNETGFVPNRTAQKLREGKSNQVLVIIPDISAAFYPDVVKGVEEVMFNRGINVLLGSTMRDSKREAELGRQLLTGTVDGLLTITGSLPESVINMPDFERKVVALSRPVKHPDVPCVSIDNYAAAKEVLNYLYAMGHRDIFHLAGPDASEVFHARSEAYQDFMAERGLREFARIRWAETFDTDAGLSIMLDLFRRERRPTAAFCASDELAIGTMAAARQEGVAVPADLAVVGVDDLKIASLVQPGLTTIAVPRIEIGRRGADLLYRRIYESSTEGGSISLAHKLIVRESSGSKR